MNGTGPPTRADFIRDIIEDDLRSGKHGGRVLTRFPPEPNGYLHIGHAKSICLNFGIALQYGSRCNLRFDDTNPAREELEYVESIQRDVQWLGFSFGERALFASDYFEEMYDLAEGLIVEGKAYVDDLSEDEIKEYRGSLSAPGRPSPYRDRTAEENLARFRQMRSGDLPDGACVLRARIDLAAPNMKMRDPLLYRIRHAHHDRTGDAWPIYPMYDWAHPLSDAIEGITHSLCTLEFENNRELYDWVIEHTRVSERHGASRPMRSGHAGRPLRSGHAGRPQQIEFARLNLDYTVLSKRKLLLLVEDGHVAGWDDPRMPTIAGMRRRGYRPEAIRAFADLIGVAKVNSTVDIGKLEYCVRDDLNWVAPRVLGVLRPLKVTITSWPEGEVEHLTGPYFPPDVGKPGERALPFGREILIDSDDFALDPPAGYQRLAPGRTVRLRHGYCITCEEVIERDGEVVELRCRHVPDSVGRTPPDVEVWGVIQWVSAGHAVPAEVRLYDRLFAVPHPEQGAGDLSAHLNPNSLQVVGGAMLEPSLAAAEPGSRWQLERIGYFVFDQDSRPGAPVLNRIVTLRDSWQARPEAPPEAEARAQSAKAKTRPPKRSRTDFRAEARSRDPVLAARYVEWPAQHGISEADADLLTGDRATGDLFAAAIVEGAPPAAVARWVINELPSALGDRPLADSPISGAGLGALVTAVGSDAITGPVAKEVLAEMAERGGDPRKIVAERGLAQVSDEGEIAAMVDEVLAGNPDKVDLYRSGKTSLLGFFVGQVMKASQGKANPQVVQKLLGQRLG
ncbi:MAG: glutamine--tRNA ligase/YqeY domain fusion protein [Actinobacteria bacterium]|nr:glutamine--tRNA ligase/YqeY domain fusion protein [Actinomycetota bacterium]